MNFGTYSFPQKKYDSPDVPTDIGTLTLTAAAVINKGDLVGYSDTGITPITPIANFNTVPSFNSFTAGVANLSSYSGSGISAIAALSNGNFVVVYESAANSSQPVFEIYNPSMAVVVARTSIDSTAVLASNVRTIGVAGLAGGGFVAIYCRTGTSEAHFARYDNSGVIQGSVTRFGASTWSFCGVTALTGGGFILHANSASAVVTFGVYNSTSGVILAPAAHVSMTAPGIDLRCVDRAGGGFFFISANGGSTQIKAVGHTSTGTINVTLTSIVPTGSIASSADIGRCVARSSQGIVVAGNVDNASVASSRVFIDNTTSISAVTSVTADCAKVSSMTNTYRTCIAYSGNDGWALGSNGSSLLASRVSVRGNEYTANTVPVLPTGGGVSGTSASICVLTDGSFVTLVNTNVSLTRIYRSAKDVSVPYTAITALPATVNANVVGITRAPTVTSLTATSTSKLTVVNRTDQGVLILGSTIGTNATGIVTGVNKFGAIDTAPMSFDGFHSTTSGQAICALVGGGYAIVSNGDGSPCRVLVLDSAYNITAVTNASANNAVYGTSNQPAICATPDGGFAIAFVHTSSNIVRVSKFNSAGASQWLDVALFAFVDTLPSHLDLVATSDGNIYIYSHNSSAGNTALYRVNSAGTVASLVVTNPVAASFNGTIDILNTGHILICGGASPTVQFRIFDISGNAMTATTTIPVTVVNQTSIIGKALPTGGFIVTGVLSSGIFIAQYTSQGELVSIETGFRQETPSNTGTRLGLACNANGEFTIAYFADTVISQIKFAKYRAKPQIALGVATNSTGIGGKVVVRSADSQGKQVSMSLNTAWAPKPLIFDHRAMNGCYGFIQGDNIVLQPASNNPRIIS
jgi:hypothetical protein